MLVARRVRAGAHAHEALEFLGASLRVVAHGLDASTLPVASRTQMCGRRLRNKHEHSAFDRTSTPAFDNLEFLESPAKPQGNSSARITSSVRAGLEVFWGVECGNWKVTGQLSAQSKKSLVNDRHFC